MSDPFDLGGGWTLGPDGTPVMRNPNAGGGMGYPQYGMVPSPARGAASGTFTRAPPNYSIFPNYTDATRNPALGQTSMGYPSIPMPQGAPTPGTPPQGMSLNSVPASASSPGGGGGVLDMLSRGAGAVGNALNPISSANAQEMPPSVQPTLPTQPSQGQLLPQQGPPIPPNYKPPAMGRPNSLAASSQSFHPGAAGVGPATGGTFGQRFINDAFGSGAQGLSIDPRVDAAGSGGFMVQQPLERAPTAVHPALAAPPAPRSVNLGYGAPQAAPPQANSPFTMVLRPNAPAEGGGRQGGNSGGPPLGTALDLSGWHPFSTPAPQMTQANWNNIPNNAFDTGGGGGRGRIPPSAIAQVPRRAALVQPAPFPQRMPATPDRKGRSPWDISNYLNTQM